ncbi:MAG: hypothetical protein DRJ43_06995 [Thermoprotei archaeon]|nr:MAG: hypothetical protein DRJ43_06995 [Thermoprotei archaeon]
MFGESKPILYWGGTGFRSLLKDVGESCSDAFAELGPGALTDLKRCIDSVGGFPLFDGEARPIVMAAYSKAGDNVSEFCGYHTRWLGRPLMERLKVEMYRILEEAINWWEGQHLISDTER